MIIATKQAQLCMYVHIFFFICKQNEAAGIVAVAVAAADNSMIYDPTCLPTKFNYKFWCMTYDNCVIVIEAIILNTIL